MNLRSLVVGAFISLARAHSRFNCPQPRNFDGFSSTSIKQGPCGTDGYDAGPVHSLNPGLFTVVLDESVGHTGAPFVFYLLDENDQHICTLLDHVPHNDASSPSSNDESTWTQYSFTLNIPDINCPKCVLALANPMTDKIASGTSCSYPPAGCFSVYHSCANVNITGSSDAPSAEDWSTSKMCIEGESWPYTTNPGVYTQESATYTSDGWLSDVPEVYTTKAGFCVDGTTSGDNNNDDGNDGDDDVSGNDSDNGDDSDGDDVNGATWNAAGVFVTLFCGWVCIVVL